MLGRGLELDVQYMSITFHNQKQRGSGRGEEAEGRDVRETERKKEMEGNRQRATIRKEKTEERQRGTHSMKRQRGEG
jgi:hypothetical protein